MAFAKAYKIPDVQTFPRSEQIAPSSRSTISSRKKSARELRQRRSDYRCCIPALAGFVSPQSIAPDGEKTFAQVGCLATLNNHKQRQREWGLRTFVIFLLCALTSGTVSDSIERVKWL